MRTFYPSINVGFSTSGWWLVQTTRNQQPGPIEEIHPGDVIRFAPGEKHWHGAARETAVTHIAIQETLGGIAVEWLEHVSDEQYQAGIKPK